MNAVSLIRLALTMSYEELEKQIDQLTGGAFIYTKTPQISELEAAHLALYMFERKIAHLLELESRR